MSTPMSTPTPRPPASSGRFVPPRRRSRVDTVVGVIGVIGRIFVVAGVMLLFFTAYLLWGTGVYTKQQQSHFEEQIACEPDRRRTKRSPKAARSRRRVRRRHRKLGDPLFSIKIPKIGLDTVVVEGVGVEELKKGPGLFPDCTTR